MMVRPTTVILGLGAVAGAGLAVWRSAEELATWRVQGPPVWWVLWRHPLRPEAPREAPTFGKHATRIFRHEKDRGWVALVKHQFSPSPMTTGAQLTGAPRRGNIYAQPLWEHDGRNWVLRNIGLGAALRKKK